MKKATSLLLAMIMLTGCTGGKVIRIEETHEADTISSDIRSEAESSETTAVSSEETEEASHESSHIVEYMELSIDTELEADKYALGGLFLGCDNAVITIEHTEHGEQELSAVQLRDELADGSVYLMDAEITDRKQDIISIDGKTVETASVTALFESNTETSEDPYERFAEYAVLETEYHRYLIFISTTLDGEDGRKFASDFYESISINERDSSYYAYDDDISDIAEINAEHSLRDVMIDGGLCFKLPVDAVLRDDSAEGHNIYYYSNDDYICCEVWYGKEYYRDDLGIFDETDLRKLMDTFYGYGQEEATDLRRVTLCGRQAVIFTVGSYKNIFICNNGFGYLIKIKHFTGILLDNLSFSVDNRYEFSDSLYDFVVQADFPKDSYQYLDRVGVCAPEYFEFSTGYDQGSLTCKERANFRTTARCTITKLSSAEFPCDFYHMNKEDFSRPFVEYTDFRRVKVDGYDALMLEIASHYLVRLIIRLSDSEYYSVEVWYDADERVEYLETWSEILDDITDDYTYNLKWFISSIDILDK